jgi:predicted Zn-dependent protease
MFSAALVAALAVANLAVAVERRGPASDSDFDGATHSVTPDAKDVQSAVWWSTWHWDKSTIVVWPQSTTTEILRAVNGWNNATDVRHPSSTSHTDISIWQANYGDIGWRGLASISGVNDSHGKRATHCHARLNTYTGPGYGVPSGRTRAWISEGVLCQEMGHCLGLHHDGTGGCMDTSRLNNGTGSNRASSAEVRLINSRY